MLNITVLVSGGGSNLQALLDAQADGRITNGRVTQVIASKAGVYALERAKAQGIAACVISRRDYANSESYGCAMLEAIGRAKPDLIVLAGYLSYLGERVVQKYSGKILNIHPALLPSFGGKGMYGLHVHKAVLAAGVKVTGATVHFVNEVIDGGKIVSQKAVEVLPDDTPEALQKRVMEQAEWHLLPQAVADFCDGKL